MLLSAQKEWVIDDVRPTLSCHASTVLPLANGGVLAAWFGGEAEGKDDVDIFVSRRVGAVWYPPQRISADPALPHWNPVLDTAGDGSVVLYFKVGRKIAHWRTWFVRSRDGGKTWSKPRELVPGDASGGAGPVKNKPLHLADGTIVAPASTEQGVWLAFADISRDCGVTWTRRPIPAPRLRSGRPIAMIQPTFWQSAPGHIHALLRTNRGRLYRSDSADGGESWCEAYPTALKNPNSGVDLARLDDGRIFLAHNPCGRSWGERTPLLLSLSEDNGETWREVLTLERRRVPGEEFSYPAVVCGGDLLHVTYTWKRQKIVYWQFKLDDRSDKE